jgi:hypothetical protein
MTAYGCMTCSLYKDEFLNERERICCCFGVGTAAGISSILCIVGSSEIQRACRPVLVAHEMIR